MDLELLAPAGDLEKLKIAFRYGADAVYFGGKDFGLRAAAGNFSIPEMEEGLALAHGLGKRCYLTLNIYPHQEDLAPLENYLEEIKELPIDGFLVSDPGAMRLLKKHIPDAEIHLSTQANLTNHESACFWYEQGVRRIVTAREMSLEEIASLRAHSPEDLEIEAFVHGAMCISYSGRCLLSNFMIGRDANRGECAHPCRWKYALVEEERPGIYYPIEEDGRGSYIMNSGDLCMIDHLPAMIAAGVRSFKIEGRIKSIFYLATVVAQYRRALDRILREVEKGTALEDIAPDPTLLAELGKVSHRPFTTGFYFGKPGPEDHNYESSDYIRDYAFLGLVKGYDPETGYALVEQRNKMLPGDAIEVLLPGGDYFSQTLEDLRDEEGTPLESAPHPKQLLKIRMDQAVEEDAMLRKINHPPVY